MSTRRPRALLSLMVTAVLVASGAGADVPGMCTRESAWQAERSPAVVREYMRTLTREPFDLRVACSRWAGSFSHKHQALGTHAPTGVLPPPRMILFPAPGVSNRQLAGWLSRNQNVRNVQRARSFVVAEFEHGLSSERLQEILDAQKIEY